MKKSIKKYSSEQICVIIEKESGENYIEDGLLK